MSPTAERLSDDSSGVTVTVEDRDDETAIVVCGGVDFDNARMVSGVIADAARRGRRIVVECAELTFVDSVALRVLVRAHSLWSHDPGFVLREPNCSVRRLLERSGQDDCFTIEPVTQPSEH